MHSRIRFLPRLAMRVGLGFAAVQALPGCSLVPRSERMTPMRVRSPVEPVATAGERVSALSLAFNSPKQSLETPFGRLNYVRFGNPKGKTLLFLPGTPDQIYTFFPLLELLAPYFDLVAYEPPGKGWSTFSKEFRFTLDDYAAALRYVIRALDLHDITLVGHSAGLCEGMHGIFVYGAKDLGISGIISINGWAPAILPEPLPLTLEEQLLGTEGIGHVLLAADGAMNHAATESFFRTVAVAREMEHLDAIVDEWMKVWRDTERGYSPAKCALTLQCHNGVSNQTSSYFRAHQRDLAQLKGMPFLVIGSTHDRMIRGEDQDNEAKRFPGMPKNSVILGDIIIDGQRYKAGHYYHRNIGIGTGMFQTLRYAWKPLPTRDRESVPAKVRESVDHHHFLYADPQGFSPFHRFFMAFDEVSGHPANDLLVVPGAGHMTPLEAPSELAQAIRNAVQNPSWSFGRSKIERF